MLKHRLQVSPDSDSSVEEILDVLQNHVKDSSNEALRRRAFTSCKQAAGESFADFFVRLKGLSEEIDVCKDYDTDCEAFWLKHGILTGVPTIVLPQKQYAPLVAKLVIDPIHKAAQPGVPSAGYATGMGTLTSCAERCSQSRISDLKTQSNAPLFTW